MNIIATIGPKTIDKWILKELIESGVDIIRLNCSHFNKDDFEKVIKNSKDLKSNLHILIDLSGKKVRVSKSLKYIYKVYNNQEIYFCGEDFYNSISFKELKERKYIPLNIKSRTIEKSNISSISMKDNTMNFEIISVKDGIIKARVIKGGIIREGKGCNLSGLVEEKNYLSKRDVENISFAIDNNADIICQSFVESSNDIILIKNIIKDKKDNFKIWAKVETVKGIENIVDILNEVDTVIIGRGDLVPEAGILDAVSLQIDAIKKIKENNKKVIIATHLLNSMKNGHLATLPEIESIYNFINIGVDGFLLAGETSIGKVPIQTVKFLKSAIEHYKKTDNNEEI
ncbi:pyruvate kinase [Clostridium tertium]|uniref:Pyruvate kinase n=1 Tax=Clostridium tertium TaxID=1559 RepID=A0A6N3AM36_9CLOT